MRPRLVVLISHPIQYYAPLYRELAARGGLELHVVYLSDAGARAYHDADFNRAIAWDVPLLEGYDYTVLRPGLELDQLGFLATDSRNLTRELDRLRPDAILLSGYASAMNWRALRWACRNGCRVLYSSDSNAAIRTRPWKAWMKRGLIGYFFSRVDAFLCTSEANREYLVRYGAGADRIWPMPFAIDVSRFGDHAPPPGSPRPCQFIWAGKLAHWKRPGDFILALRQVVDDTGLECHALLVGDGPIRDEVAALAKALPVACHLEMTGFANQAAMPHLLQRAQTLVFTSEIEPYGLIATEAAAAGLALIVAEGIGCVGDTVLARPGVNARTYPPRDVAALARAMRELRTDGETLQRMQAASLAIAREHDLPVAASAIESAVKATTEGKYGGVA